MELKQQVISLEIAQRLAKLGIKGESLYWWQIDRTGGVELRYGKTNDNFGLSVIEWYPAYSVAELGEMLPWMIKKIPPFAYLKIEKDHHGWIIKYEWDGEVTAEEVGDTLADAMGLMACYLKENNLL